jgi:hypothetical protein
VQPPHNPYSGFPGPNDPIPPIGGSGGGGAPDGVPPRKPEISFDAISDAWPVMISAFGVYAGATVITAITGVLLGIYIQLFLTYDYQGNPELTGPGLLLLIGAGFIMFILTAGMMRMAINHLRTGRANLGDMFSVIDVFPSLLLAAFLLSIVFTIGCCLCCLPGLLFNGLYLFVIPLIVDQRMGPLNAMKTSWRTVAPQMWMALVFALVLLIIVSAGTSVFYLGLLFALPLSVMSVAVTYRNFFDGGNKPFNGGPVEPSGPVSPIASPFS